MKRWTPEAIELLKKRSEQSRRGEPVTPGTSKPTDRDGDQLSITFGKAGGRRRKDTAVVVLSSNEGQSVEMRIRQKRLKPL